MGAGHPALSFTVAVASGAAKLNALAIALPRGITFVRRHAGGRLVFTGVVLAGARVKSLALSHGRLVITLRRAVSSLTVRITSSALSESSSLKARARAKTLGSLQLIVTTENTSARRTTIRAQVANVGRKGGQ